MSVAEILAQIDSLPPMPAVAVQLLEATQDPDVDLSQVAHLIECDPAMTANLLRACNSPFYGLRREVTSIRQATGLLGLKQVVQIAVTLLASRYLAPSQEGYDLAPGELWKSSVAAGIAAELLARECRYPHPSTAYTAGLLQDMGKIVLAERLGGLLPQIRKLTEEQGIGWEEAERQVVGIPHPEVGAALLERWNFPATLVEAVRCHHHPASATLDPTLSHISHLADALTMTLGMGLGGDGLAYHLDEHSVVALGLDRPGRMDILLARLAEQLQQAEDLLRSPVTGH
ncbi:MAG: HDOD domain-containing protein [Deferrisomatales bacterium]|nr:HDOD domain-containing protein [Deferrisomatales bacterium]